MNTAKQAMENMEYVRRLLEERQPGFSASVELAVSFIHRQIEGSEETMELTLPPGRHETIEKDPVHEWRVDRLTCLGIPWPMAEAAAGHVRLAPDGGAGAAGLPFVARTPHPPLIPTCD